MSSGWFAAFVFSALVAQGLLVASWALGRRWLEQRSRLKQAGAAAAWAGWRRFRVRRSVPEDSNGTIRSFKLVPVDGKPLPAFRAGQFVTIQTIVPSTTGPALATRCYSLSDRSAPDHYRISVKRVCAGPGRVAGAVSNLLHDRVHEGDELLLRAPAGSFVVDLEDRRPAVLVGAGIGITPLWCMLKTLLAADPQREVWLFYGVRNGDEHPYRDELAALRAAHAGLHAIVCYSRPAARDRPGLDYAAAGHVDIALIKRHLPHNRLPFYICGPGPMVESMVPALREWGVPPVLLRFEAFGPSSPGGTIAAAQPAEARVVTFSRSQRTVSWEPGVDQSLLGLAERHGISVPSGCRTGVCGSCQTPVMTGSVSYRQMPQHEVEPGNCLLCVGAPASDLVLGA